MENEQTPDEGQPQQDTTPAAPVFSGPESSDETPSPQKQEAPFDDPTSVEEDNNVVVGEEEPPAPNNDDPGEDTEVPNDAAPEELSIESVEADHDDETGQGV